MATKKLRSVGRFGARYGRKLKDKVLKIEKVQKAKHICPYCGKSGGVKRLSSGIWYCKKCDTKFTGKAYKPE